MEAGADSQQSETTVTEAEAQQIATLAQVKKIIKQLNNNSPRYASETWSTFFFTFLFFYFYKVWLIRIEQFVPGLTQTHSLVFACH